MEEIHVRGNLSTPNKKAGRDDGLGQGEAVEVEKDSWTWKVFWMKNPQVREGLNEISGGRQWWGRRDQKWPTPDFSLQNWARKVPVLFVKYNENYNTTSDN